MIRHSFSFNTITDSADSKYTKVEIIDYQYGNNRQLGTYANKEMVSLGKTFKKIGITGLMARGEFLYVKWRMLATGKVYEDRVDLTTRLPHELENQELRFVVRGQQLYVFLIDRQWNGNPWKQEPRENKYQPIPGGVKSYEGYRHMQLYPDPPPLP